MTLASAAVEILALIHLWEAFAEAVVSCWGLSVHVLVVLPKGAQGLTHCRLSDYIILALVCSVKDEWDMGILH